MKNILIIPVVLIFGLLFISNFAPNNHAAATVDDKGRAKICSMAAIVSGSVPAGTRLAVVGVYGESAAGGRAPVDAIFLENDSQKADVVLNGVKLRGTAGGLVPGKWYMIIGKLRTNRVGTHYEFMYTLEVESIGPYNGNNGE